LTWWLNFTVYTCDRVLSMAIGRDKTKDKKSVEIVAYSELAVRNNASVVKYCRTAHFIQY